MAQPDPETNLILRYERTDGNIGSIQLPIVDPSDGIAYSLDEGQTYTAINSSNQSVTITAQSVTIYISGGSFTHFGTNLISSLNGIWYLTQVQSWGNYSIQSMRLAFLEAISLTAVPGTIPNSVTNMELMFSNAVNFNGDIGSWDVSNVTNMFRMFAPASENWVLGALSFNQNISSWDVSNVTNMGEMFMEATSYNNGIDIDDNDDVETKNNKAQQGRNSLLYIDGNPGNGLTQFNRTNTKVSPNYQGFAAFSNLLIGLNETATQTFYTLLFEPFLILRYETTTGNIGSIQLPIVDPSDDIAYSLDEGQTYTNIESANQAVTIDASSVTIYISDGSFTHFGTNSFVPLDGIQHLTQVLSWGNYSIQSMLRAFYGATSLTDVPGTIPNSVTNMEAMFYNAISFDGNIGNWNVSNVTNMGAIFLSATSFNQNIGGWDVSNVTNMAVMFFNATNFNQEIKDWDVSKVTNMGGMFSNATNFNKDIKDWNVSNVTNMVSMFQNATSFDGNIDSWNVSNVTDMSGMFRSAVSFNQEIKDWNVSQVTNMGDMFRDAVSFNQEIKGWNVSQVTDMNGMFRSAVSFNQEIKDWNVSSVTTMRGMFFNATNFNRYIGDWDVSNVTDMEGMFFNATKYNNGIVIGDDDDEQTKNIKAQQGRNSLLYKNGIQENGLTQFNLTNNTVQNYGGFATGSNLLLGLDNTAIDEFYTLLFETEPEPPVPPPPPIPGVPEDQLNIALLSELGPILSSYGYALANNIPVSINKNYERVHFDNSYGTLIALSRKISRSTEYKNFLDSEDYNLPAVDSSQRVKKQLTSVVTGVTLR